MRSLCSKYLENVVRFNSLENEIIPSEMDNAALLAQLQRITEEKREIQKEQNQILAQLLPPFEDGTKDTDAESVEILRGFARDLSAKSQNVDNAIALRIHTILLRYAQETQNWDLIAEELYGCGICQWQLNMIAAREPRCRAFFDIENYREQYGCMSPSGRTFYIRCLGNQLMNYTTLHPELLLSEGERILQELEDLKAAYGELPLNEDTLYLSVYQNMLNVTAAFQIDAANTPENKEKALLYAQKALARYINKGESEQEVCEHFPVFFYTQFHAGRMDIDTLLEKLDQSSLPLPGKTQRYNCKRVFSNTAIYLLYLKSYSGLPETEIQERTAERVDRVLQYTEQIRRDEQSSFINLYLNNFIICTFNTLPYRRAVEILLQVMERNHKPTCIHTLVVERICSLVLKRVLDVCPEQLGGVAGYTAEEIPEHRRELITLMRASALLHDIGKYQCFDIVSNTSRKLEEVEFAGIKYHPASGCRILSSSNSISPVIVDCVLQHHRWHNGRGGYPDASPTSNQPLLDILSVADSLDAATDRFGRSYNNPKSIAVLMDEFEQFRDTRYAGFVIDVLKEPDTMRKLEHILNEERQDIICQVWRSETPAIHFPE